MNRLLSTPEARSGLFFAMVHVGALATVLLISTLVFDLPDFVDGLPQGILLVSVGVIMAKRLRDEYVEELWRAGTSAAFVLAIAAFLVLPLVIGISERIRLGAGDPRDFSVVVQWPLAVALSGFYAAFYRRMLADRAR